MPLFAPVISARLPVWLGMSVTVQPLPGASIVADPLMPFFYSCRPSLSEPPHIPVKNTVSFQIPGSDEQDQHQASSPAEDLEWKRACHGSRLLAKDHSACKTDACRKRQQYKRIPAPLAQIARRNEERSIENAAQGKHA